MSLPWADQAAGDTVAVINSALEAHLPACAALERFSTRRSLGGSWQSCGLLLDIEMWLAPFRSLHEGSCGWEKPSRVMDVHRIPLTPSIPAVPAIDIHIRERRRASAMHGPHFATAPSVAVRCSALPLAPPPTSLARATRQIRTHPPRCK